MGEGSKRVYSALLSQGSLSSMTLAKASRYGGARKDKITFCSIMCTMGKLQYNRVYLRAVMSDCIIFAHQGAFLGIIDDFQATSVFVS